MGTVSARIFAVVFIVFQSCPYRQKNVKGQLQSSHEELIRLISENPDKCRIHDTVESELIPVSDYDGQFCRLSNSICQYRFSSNTSYCLQLSTECQDVINQTQLANNSKGLKWNSVCSVGKDILLELVSPLENNTNTSAEMGNFKKVTRTDRPLRQICYAIETKATKSSVPDEGCSPEK